MAEASVSTLRDGTRIISELMPAVRSVSLGLWIGVGARDERPTQAGVSHLLEHMLFRGTDRYSAQEIAELFDGIGGELNAATAREYTVLHARVLDDHLGVALDAMTDMVLAPTFADLDAERDVVLEEIAMVEDAPQELVHDLCSAAVFGEHPLGRPVIGEAGVVSAMTRRSLAAFHRRRYRRDAIVVAAAGNVDHRRLVRRVSRLARAKPAPGGNAAARRQLLRRRPSPRALLEERDTEQFHVCIGALGVDRSDPRRFGASVLDTVLGGSASSRLFQEVREKRGLAYSVYSYASQYQETGELGVYVGTRAENLVTCMKLVCEQIDDVAGGGVTTSELDRAKENLKGRIMLSLESTGARMNRLGRAMTADGELLSLDDVIEEIDRVETDDLARLAEELLAAPRRSLAGIGPGRDLFLRAAEAVNPQIVEVAS